MPPETSIENSRLRAYQNGSRTAEKFRLWRIASLAAYLPDDYDTENFRKNARVVVNTEGRHTLLDINEFEPAESGIITTDTSIVLERETKQPHKIASLGAESTLTDDFAEEHGIAPVRKHFELYDETSTLSLVDVKRSVQFAKGVIEAAQTAELIRDGHMPLFMAGPM